jgi:hypothetical protein
VFQAESEFCDNMELMNRARLLKAAGVNPDDAAAVSAYFNKVGSNLIFAPVTTDN